MKNLKRCPCKIFYLSNRNVRWEVCGAFSTRYLLIIQAISWYCDIAKDKTNLFSSRSVMCVEVWQANKYLWSSCFVHVDRIWTKVWISSFDELVYIMWTQLFITVYYDHKGIIVDGENKSVCLYRHFWKVHMIVKSTKTRNCYFHVVIMF